MKTFERPEWNECHLNEVIQADYVKQCSGESRHIRKIKENILNLESAHLCYIAIGSKNVFSPPNPLSVLRRESLIFVNDLSVYPLFDYDTDP